jgi:hypothetical protein
MIGNDVHAPWEYRTLIHEYLGHGEMDRAEKRKQLQELNSLGSEGWELVAAVPITSEDATRNVMYVFKRRID